jgi:hypothetical protein
MQRRGRCRVKDLRNSLIKLLMQLYNFDEEYITHTYSHRFPAVVTGRVVCCIFASTWLKQAIHPFYSTVFFRGAVDLAVVRREDKVAMGGANLLEVLSSFQRLTGSLGALSG